METYRGYTAEMIDDMPIERFLRYLPDMKDTTKGGYVPDLVQAMRDELER